MLDVTSHASIAYRKQLTPQRTMGTIGTVWQESTPSKETTGPAQTRTAKRYENEQSKMPNGARQPLLEPTGFSQLVQVLNLQLRLLLPLAVSSNGAAFLQLSTTSSGERPLAEFAN